MVDVSERGRVHQAVDLVPQYIAQLPPARKFARRDLHEQRDTSPRRLEGSLVSLGRIGLIGVKLKTTMRVHGLGRTM